MSNLNYVPSWLDSAMTLLEKLNKCVEKIETIVNTVVTVTKTADDALSLAKTNEADIALNESDITELQGNVMQLNGDVAQLKTDVPLIEEKINRALVAAQAAQTTADSKSPKLYLHKITLTEGTQGIQFVFLAINEESQNYRTKFASEQEFDVSLTPFEVKFVSRQGQTIKKCLTAQLSDITFAHHKDGTVWNPQNCAGTLYYGAYANTDNNIVSIDEMEWYSATVDDDIVQEL